MSRSRHMKSRGFTLIELLVVVAIIALLASILLPSLKNAREQAKRAVCASGMKQLVYGINMYTHDSKGVYPRGVEGTGPDGAWQLGDGWADGGWVPKTHRYVADVGPYFCPNWDFGKWSLDDIEAITNHPQLKNKWGFWVGYGLNSSEQDGFGCAMTPHRGFVQRRESEIALPGETYLLGETWEPGNGRGAGQPYMYLVGREGIGWADYDIGQGWKPPSTSEIEVFRLHFRHGLTRPVGLNFAFVDGHVAWQRGREMNRLKHWRVAGDCYYAVWEGECLPLDDR